MAGHNQNPWLRPIKATGYSLAGLKATFLHEQAFRQEILVLIIIVPLALWLGNSAVEYVMLIGSWVLVMIVELLNSAVEAAIDRIGYEHNELSERAKDIGSAAVFVAIIFSIITWALVLTSHPL